RDPHGGLLEGGAELLLALLQPARGTHLRQHAPDRLGQIVEILHRLGDEVVYAQAQRLDDHRLAALAGHHDHRQVVARRLQPGVSVTGPAAIAQPPPSFSAGTLTTCRKSPSCLIASTKRSYSTGLVM